MLTLALLATLQVSPAVQKKLDAARAAVEKSPDDAAANLALGKLLCFDAGDWEGGLPHLAKGGDKDFAPLAEKDLAPKPTPYDYVETGDAWLALEKKQKPIAGKLRERALFHFGQAWGKTDDALAKGTLRERMKSLQAKGPESKTLGAMPSPGWSNATATKLSGLDREYARSGAQSVKLLPPDPNSKSFQGWLASDPLPCAGGAKVTFSCWMLTTGGAGFQEELRIKFRNAKQGAAEHLALIAVKGDSDLPVWTKVEGETVAPVGTVTMELSFKRNPGATSPAFLDDVSVKVDGREILKNGSFEGK